jgi:hypothetical protein
MDQSNDALTSGARDYEPVTNKQEILLDTEFVPDLGGKGDNRLWEFGPDERARAALCSHRHGVTQRGKDGVVSRDSSA